MSNLLGDVMAELKRVRGTGDWNSAFSRWESANFKPMVHGIALPLALVSSLFLASIVQAGDLSEGGNSSLPSAEQYHPMEMAGLTSGGLKLDTAPMPGNLINPQITRNKLRQAGFILPETASVASIIGSVRPSDSMATGNLVYVDIGKQQGVVEGDLFTIFTKDQLVRHPTELVESPSAGLYYERPLAQPSQTYFTPIGRPVGYMVVILGTLEIIEATDSMSKAIVQESFSSIPLGSLITPYQETATPVTRQTPKENMSLEGTIVAIKDNKYSGALADIVYADVGSNDNVSPGDRFEAYIIPEALTTVWNHSDPLRKPLMPEVVAQLQVLATEGDTATLYVEKNTDAVEVGQRIRYKPVTGISPVPNVASLAEAPTYVMEEGFKEEGLGEEGFPASNGDVSDDEIAEPSPFARQDEDEAGSAGEGEAGAESDGSAEALADAGASAGAQADEAKLLAFHPTTELKDILFKFDRFDLDETSITILKNNAQFLKEHPTVKIQIQGHSDERGTNNYNLALGERRSTSIKNFLVAQGVEPDRIFVLSYGEEKPFCFESNEICWQENRRAHFMVTEENGESKF